VSGTVANARPRHQAHRADDDTLVAEGRSDARGVIDAGLQHDDRRADAIGAVGRCGEPVEPFAIRER
jgi:hypothetical protein